MKVNAPKKTAPEKKPKVNAVERIKDKLLSLGFMGAEDKSKLKGRRDYWFERRGRDELKVRPGGSVRRNRSFPEFQLQVNLDVKTDTFVWAFVLGTQWEAAKGSGLYSQLVQALGSHSGGR